MTAGRRVPNVEQEAVIRETEKNLILFASAGTGKTFTVARRVEKILDRELARPEEVLCLTFTIKAANEMKNDILEYAGEKANRTVISTIHSFAYHLLKEEFVRNPEYYTMPAICDETEAGEIAGRVLLEMGLDEKAEVLERKRAPLLTGFISLMKQQRELYRLYTENEEDDFQRVYRRLREEKPELCRKALSFYRRSAGGDGEDPLLRRLLEAGAGTWLHRYSEELRRSNLLDFDDLICQTHHLLERQEPREYWRKRYRYITIDEMQDTSELEYDTLKMLFPGNHILMCGDFFQTIYQWRGSNPEKVLEEYVREFHAERHMFFRNYRSTQLLTKASFGYLTNTCPELLGRYCPPEVMTESRLAGDPILNVRKGSREACAAWIYDYLDQNRPEDPSDAAIICRTNSVIGELYRLLNQISRARGENGLRFFTVESGVKFFRRIVIRDMLAFFRILVNPADSEAFRRLTERYVKNVGEKTAQKIQERGPYGISLSSYADPALYRDGDPYEALIRAYRQGNIVVYDTETTGLDLTKDQALQISAIRLGPGGEIADTLDQMMIPTVEIHPLAQATHHQTMETILQRGGIPIRDGLRKFLDFSRGAILVGHNNLGFDRPLVRRQLKEEGLPMPEIEGEFDTLVLARQLLPKSVNHKLGTLCDHFGIVNEAAHDALGDITATGKVLCRFLDQELIPKREQRRQLLDEFRPKFEPLFQYLQKLRTDYLEKNDISGMAHALTEIVTRRKDNRDESSQAVLEDFLYTVDHSEIDDGAAYLQEMIRDSALSGSQIDLLIRKLKKIPIITVHQSKGCEFDTVIIGDADGNSYPSYQAQKNNMEDEEKRVFYVAISRAKRKLILVSARQIATQYSVRENRQSPYIAKIPKECVQEV